MNNIWLITKREYFTRVKNKTFLLTTFLAPIGIILFFGVLGFIMSRGSDDRKEIYVIDSQELLKGELKSRDNLIFTFTDQPLDTLLASYKRSEHDGIIQLLPFDSTNYDSFTALFHSDDALAIDETFSIQNRITRKLRDFKLKALEIDDNVVKKLDTDVTIQQKSVKDDKEISAITNIVGSVLGGIVGYAMFFIILIYGSQVMRSVTEEKINRIVEVLISSVKPFQLMMGKVMGVGMVGLTQIGIWLLIFPVLAFLASTFFGIEMFSSTDQINEIAKEIPKENLDSMQSKMESILVEVMKLPWLKIIPLLLLYFLGGYFAYASLFAAIGSAVGDDVNEAQSLTFLVMMPLIIAVYIGFSAVQAPNSSMAVWASMVPLLSSIVMPVRLPIDPPFWQLAISVVLLLLFVVFFIWLAGRIYRVGILMYGKKASFKELAKWLFYSG